MFNAQTTDPRLIEAVKDWRDDANLREFYERYAVAIRRHACGSGLSETEVEDVLQETMVKVARYLPNFKYDRTVCKFRTWLNQIINQRIFEALHRRRRGSFSEAALDEIRELVHAPEAPTGDPVVQAEIQHRLLEACLARVRARVKPRHWQVFEAHALHGLTAEETARRHDTTAANVWVIRHRLLKALRAEWQELLSKPFPAGGET
ncbi:MAG: sigma-70 family RNA polymerase sigma factor [Verrucomicrobiae bacterium]|nr:sigma-70 family RNA polymerase sigma factor [Verrucomicrobiae bacterium]